MTDATVAEAIKHKNAFPEHEIVIREMQGCEYNDLPKALEAAAKAHEVKMGAPLLKHIMKSLAVEDENVPASLDEEGNPVVDASTKVIERVPYLEDVSEHMEREVLPFVPDMQWDESLARWAPNCR